MTEHIKRPRSKQRSASRKAPTLNHLPTSSPKRQTCIQIPFMVGDCPLCHSLRLQAPGLVQTGSTVPKVLCVFHEAQSANSG